METIVYTADSVVLVSCTIDSFLNDVNGVCYHVTIFFLICFPWLAFCPTMKVCFIVLVCFLKKKKMQRLYSTSTVTQMLYVLADKSLAYLVHNEVTEICFYHMHKWLDNQTHFCYPVLCYSIY